MLNKQAEPRMIPMDAKVRKAILYAGYGVLVTLVLFVVYYGSYLSLLARKVYAGNGRDPITGQNRFDVEPHYRFESDVLTVILMPAHRLDRRIRNEYWTTIEHSNGMMWKNPKLAHPPSP